MPGGQHLSPIVWGLDLAADPPCYEVLFLGRLDDDHRVGRVPFVRPPLPTTQECDALISARLELDALTVDAVLEVARNAELINR